MSLPNDNKFKKIHDAKLIGHQLLAAKERQETIFVWRIIGDKKILAPVRLDLIKRLQGEIVIRPVANQEALFDQVVGGSSDVINFFFPHSSLLFQCKSKQHEADGSVTLSYPQFIAQVERRKWLRLSVEHNPKLRIQFCKIVKTPKPVNQFISKHLLDLGAGGVAFNVSKAEAKFFIAGEIVKNIEILIGDIKYIVSGEILRVSELREQKTWKVSVQFVAIGKREQDDIAKFVFENIRQDEKAI